MKKIGRGWQYEVCDLENGRVRKQKYSPLLQYLVICRDLLGDGNPWPFVEARSEQVRVDNDERESIKHLNKIRDIVDWGMFGNPKFIQDGVYEQDKLEDLETVFKHASIEEGKEIFNKFMSLIYKEWEYGFGDKIFNFLDNNGRNKKGELVQLDFGELEFEKEEMRKNIRKKCWLERSSYWALPKGILKEYYRQMMNPEVMERKLDELWGIKLNKF